jgi:hypothetical protein
MQQGSKILPVVNPRSAGMKNVDQNKDYGNFCKNRNKGI